MKKSAKTTQPPAANTISAGFVPSQEQIDAVARRLMPEIKKFFADEQIQKEFAKWQESKTR